MIGLANETALDECPQRLDRIGGLESLGHPFDCVERESTPEDTHPEEQLAMLGPEEPRAPFDGSSDRALTLWNITRTVDQQRQGMIESREDLDRSEHANPSGSELECQRDAVQRGGDRRDCRSIRRGSFEGGFDGPRTLQEEAGGREIGQRSKFDALLAGDVQEHSTRREHRHPRAGEKSPDLRRGLDHLLDIVQHEQQPPIGQCRAELLVERAISGVPDAERLSNRRDHEVRVAHRSEIHEGRAVRVRRLDRASGSDCQATLADASRTGDRHQPSSVDSEHPDDRVELDLAPEHAGHR
nr:hypothetical protein [Agromyces sp. Marseille-P2726]